VTHGVQLHAVSRVPRPFHSTANVLVNTLRREDSPWFKCTSHLPE